MDETKGSYVGNHSDDESQTQEGLKYRDDYSDDKSSVDIRVHRYNHGLKYRDDYSDDESSVDIRVHRYNHRVVPIFQEPIPIPDLIFPDNIIDIAIEIAKRHGKYDEEGDEEGKMGDFSHDGKHNLTRVVDVSGFQILFRVVREQDNGPLRLASQPHSNVANIESSTETVEAKALESHAHTLTEINAAIRLGCRVDVPKRYHHKASSGPSRPPYIAMSCYPYSSAHAFQESGRASDGWHTTLLQSLAYHTAALLQLRYSALGSFMPGPGRFEDSRTAVVPGFYRSSNGQICQRRLVHTLTQSPKAEDYLIEEGLWEHPSPTSNVKKGAEWVAKTALRCLPWKSGSLIDDDTKGPFTLCHPDLDLRHLIVNDEGVVKGMVDWDCTQTVPIFVACGRLPKWLASESGDLVLTRQDKKIYPLLPNKEKRLVDLRSFYYSCLAEIIAAYQRFTVPKMRKLDQEGADDSNFELIAARPEEEILQDLHDCYIHNWVWQMSQTISGRHRLCTRIIQDMLPLEMAGGGLLETVEDVLANLGNNGRSAKLAASEVKELRQQVEDRVNGFCSNKKKDE